MSRLPAHIIEEIKKRRERKQKEQRPFLEIPAPDNDPYDENPKDDDSKKEDSGVVIIDLSIDLYEDFSFEVRS